MSSGQVALVDRDIERFARLSGDYSPLHVSHAYARLTPFGRPVAHGVHAALGALATVPPGPGHVIAVDLQFLDPIAPGNAYEIVWDESETLFSLRDGRQTALRGSVQRAEVPAIRVDRPPARGTTVSHARESGSPQPVGTTFAGRYELVFDAEDGLLAGARNNPGLPREMLEALLCGSYLVGMEYPGAPALLCRMNVALKARSSDCGGFGGFDYTMKVVRHDPRFELCSLEAELRAGNSEVVAVVTATAMYRLDAPIASTSDFQAIAGLAESLSGQRVLITGGSRGLGQAMTYAFASAGAHVTFTYAQGEANARATVEAAVTAGWCVQAVRANAADRQAAAQLDRTMSESGGVDILISNAFPSPWNLTFEPQNLDRVSTFVEQALSTVVTPLAALAPQLEARQGWHVLISSAYVEAGPPRFAHYVAAKCAAEGVSRSVAKEYPSIRTLIVRPPKLLTSMTNTPLGRVGARDTSSVAAEIVRTVAAGGRPGGVTVISGASQ